MDNKTTNDPSVTKGKISSLKYLLHYILPYKFYLIAILIVLSFSSFAVLILGEGMRYIIDQGFSHHNPAMLDRGLYALIGLIVLFSFASYSRVSLINLICEKIVAKIRLDVYRHITCLSPGFFEVNKTSDMISRLTVDTTLLSSIIGNASSFALRNMIMMVGGIGFLMATSLKLTCYVILTVPIVLIPIMLIGRRLRKLSKIVQEEMVDISAHIEESINGIKTVQALNREEIDSNQFGQLVANALKSMLKRIRMRAFMVAVVILFVCTAIAFVLWIGGHDMLEARISAGDLSSFIFYAVIVVSSIGGLSEAMGDLQRAAGATERLFGLLEIKSDIIDAGKSNPQNNDISFNFINFAYPARTSTNVLHNFTLKLKQGQKIAIIGPSGSGKTTLFQLLLRFYDPSAGSIHLGDIDIRNISLQDLRSKFALVPQDPVIFSASAYENILMGKADATEEQVLGAAQAAQILEFLQTLPQGIHTFLGEKGVRISGGQKQRIAIARAILQNPEILLLDEATSNLDTENAKLVTYALEQLMSNRTTIMIAHSLKHIKDIEQIIVMKQGTIEAIGTHAELLNNNRFYTQLILQGE